MNVLHAFNTITLIHIFWKTKFFFKKLKYRFLVEITKTENTSKLLSQKPVLRQIEWGLQNRPIIKGGVLPVTASFFGKFISILQPFKKS